MPATVGADINLFASFEPSSSRINFRSSKKFSLEERLHSSLQSTGIFLGERFLLAAGGEAGTFRADLAAWADVGGG